MSDQNEFTEKSNISGPGSSTSTDSSIASLASLNKPHPIRISSIHQPSYRKSSNSSRAAISPIPLQNSPFSLQSQNFPFPPNENNSSASIHSVLSESSTHPAEAAEAESYNPYRDEEDDYLEFKLNNRSSEGIMKFGSSPNSKEDKAHPQVIRYSLSDSNRPSPLTSPYSIDSFTQNINSARHTSPFHSNVSASSLSSAQHAHNPAGSVAKSIYSRNGIPNSGSSTHSLSSSVLEKPSSAASSRDHLPNSTTVATDQNTDTNLKITQTFSPREEHLNRLSRKEELQNGIHPSEINTKLDDVDNMTSSHSSPHPETPSSATSLHDSSFLDTPSQLTTSNLNNHNLDISNNDISDYDSHHVESDEEDWQEMPTVASYDVYNDKGKKVVIRKEDHLAELDKLKTYEDEQKDGSKYGYTRVSRDDDAKSVDSMDENTDFLFDEDELKRNPLAQLETNKKMLTDSQRIAYVGLCKLALIEMATDLAQVRGSWRIGKKLSNTQKSFARWSQRMTARLYQHMDISPEEQHMMESLSKHGIEAADLAPSLLKTAKIQNPFADDQSVSSAQGSAHSQENAGESEIKGIDDLHYESPETYRHEAMIEIDVRWTILCDLFLMLISDSVYDSRSRTLLMHVAEYLKISKLEVCQFEKKVAEALEIDDASTQNWRETHIMEERRKKSLKKKYVYVGLATIGGGIVLGLSAGLLAPVIGAGLAAGLSTIGISGTAGFLAGAGGTAVVTTTGIAVGSKIGLEGMNRRMGHVKTFEFRPLHNNRRVNLIVTVSGWLLGKEDDVRLPFSTVDPVMGDLYSVLWEPEMMTSMGQTINILATEILTQSVQQILGSTILTALMASIQLPMALSKLGYLLDNPWNVSLDRAWASGLILADTLIRRNLGVRPVTLVGFSLGARVIYSCLVELARQGACGLIQDVFIFGSPVVVKKDQFALARSIVSGRFVNCYSKKDWILGYLFRATSGGLGQIAGLAPVKDIHGVESVDITEHVDGHMGYRAAMPSMLSQLGWEVSSEEFEEIEDPDPELQRERQRKLIEEFDVAKRQMDKEIAQGKRKKKSSLFGWLKPKEKELWEMYEQDLKQTHKKEAKAVRDKLRQEQRERGEPSLPPSRASTSTSSQAPSGISTPSQGSAATIFDVDAIRRELETLANSNLPEAKMKNFDFSKDELPIEVNPLSGAKSQHKNTESVEMMFDDPFLDDEYERNGAQNINYRNDVHPHNSVPMGVSNSGSSVGSAGDLAAARRPSISAPIPKPDISVTNGKSLSSSLKVPSRPPSYASVHGNHTLSSSSNKRRTQSNSKIRAPSISDATNSDHSQKQSQSNAKNVVFTTADTTYKSASNELEKVKAIRNPFGDDNEIDETWTSPKNAAESHAHSYDTHEGDIGDMGDKSKPKSSDQARFDDSYFDEDEYGFERPSNGNVKMTFD